MGVFEDPDELGRRISAARGYARMQRPGFAQAMGVSVPTLRRWEKGEVASLGRTPEQRRQLAERVVRVSGCPPALLGLESADVGGGDQLADVLDRLKALEAEAFARLGEEKARELGVGGPETAVPSA